MSGFEIAKIALVALVFLFPSYEDVIKVEPRRREKEKLRCIYIKEHKVTKQEIPRREEPSRSFYTKEEKEEEAIGREDEVLEEERGDVMWRENTIPPVKFTKEKRAEEVAVEEVITKDEVAGEKEHGDIPPRPMSHRLVGLSIFKLENDNIGATDWLYETLRNTGRFDINTLPTPPKTAKQTTSSPLVGDSRMLSLRNEGESIFSSLHVPAYQVAGSDYAIYGDVSGEEGFYKIRLTLLRLPAQTVVLIDTTQGSREEIETWISSFVKLLLKEVPAYP